MYRKTLDPIGGAAAPAATSNPPADERPRRLMHAHVTVVAAELDSLDEFTWPAASPGAGSDRRARHADEDSLVSDLMTDMEGHL